MGSSKRTISQQAFEALVAENMEDLGMDPDEALQDALQTLTLQGVDLSGLRLKFYSAELREASWGPEGTKAKRMTRKPLSGRRGLLRMKGFV